MFIGHYAVAFAAKRAAPVASLGTLFLACELVDGIWPAFLLLGIERVEISSGDTAFTPLAFVLYLSLTRARDRTGLVAFWAFVAFLIAAYLGAAFGPPPPSVEALAWTGLAGWLFVPWGYWIDRHREAAKA